MVETTSTYRVVFMCADYDFYALGYGFLHSRILTLYWRHMTFSSIWPSGENQHINLIELEAVVFILDSVGPEMVQQIWNQFRETEVDFAVCASPLPFLVLLTQ